MELLGHLKQYDSGKIGLDSVVAQLAYLNDPDFCLHPDDPYTELWMSDHCDGSAIVKTSGSELRNVLARKLPFLFKAISLKSALAIEIHPTIEQAVNLHAEKPKIYKDSNHKHKIVIALTPFLLLSGFRTREEIYKICKEIRPLKKIVGEKYLEALKENDVDALKNVFKEVIYVTKKLLRVSLNEINREYRPEMVKYRILDTFKGLYCKFRENVGVLLVFFLNVVNLIPGQSSYIPPNHIHAYLNGDALECSAISKNVIRGALTSEPRDLKAFVTFVDYSPTTVDENIFQPIYYDMYRTIYSPPIYEYAVVRLKLPLDAGEYTLEYEPVDSILVVVHGAGYLRIPRQCVQIPIKRGNIYYIPPCAAPKLTFEPIECETCEDVPLNYEIDAEIGVFSIEVHTDSYDQKSDNKSISYVSNTPTGEDKISTSSSCNPDIEKCSSQHVCEVVEEEEEIPSSCTEDVPLSKLKYKDFEVYIASTNVFFDFKNLTGFCCPAMRAEEESDW